MRFVLEIKDKNNESIYSNPSYNLLKVISASKFAKKRGLEYKVRVFNRKTMKANEKEIKEVYKDLGLDYDKEHPVNDTLNSTLNTGEKLHGTRNMPYK